MEFEEILSSLPEKEGNGLYRKDFLRTWDMSDEDIKLIASAAAGLKALRDRNISSKFFDSGIAVS
ncbi:MAG: knotted carbamoyltransferase YgeW, partial [Clostridia bacterium]